MAMDLPELEEQVEYEKLKADPAIAIADLERAFDNYCQGCSISRELNSDSVVKAIEDAKVGWKSAAKAI